MDSQALNVGSNDLGSHLDRIRRRKLYFYDEFETRERYPQSYPLICLNPEGPLPDTSNRGKLNKGRLRRTSELGHKFDSDFFVFGFITELLLEFRSHRDTPECKLAGPG